MGPCSPDIPSPRPHSLAWVFLCVESALSYLWLAEIEGTDQELLEAMFTSEAEEEKDRAAQSKARPCEEPD